MNVEEFFKLFLIELEQNPNLRNYYKFLNNSSGFQFRKAYFCQRLQYIIDNIPNSNLDIWDCGCGYGTTGIFLSLNGIKTHGSTLEFYYKEIPARLEYWKKYGDPTLFSYSYENIFDTAVVPASKDMIIVQDTLHHLEPLQDALKLFYKILRPGGKLLAVEENGNNIIQNLKLFLQRGNKRIIEVYDEHLKKNIIMGNENIRGFKEWKKELNKGKFEIVNDTTQYIRLYPPFVFKNNNTKKLIEREQQLWKNNSFLKEKFFFGLNFIADKSVGGRNP